MNEEHSSGEDQNVPINLIMNNDDSNSNWWNPQTNIRTLDNKLLFCGDIEESTGLELNKSLMEMDLKLQNTKNSFGEDFNPVCHLRLCTYGGEVLSALSTVDIIRNMKSDVYTYIDGNVASAGTFLSVIGKKRFMGKHAHLLIHELSSGYYGKLSEMEDEVYNCQRLMKLIKGIYKEHTKIPMKKLDELLKGDIWLDAEECLEYKIIDEIL